MKKYLMAEIISNNKICENIFEMVIAVPEIVHVATAGQFVNVYTGSKAHILSRPISISEIDREKGILTLVYQVIGKGTEIFSTLKSGENVDIIGPLGNGFSLPEGEKIHILVGGGIGIPPLLQLAKELKGEIIVLIGAKTSPILVEKFEVLGAKVYIATDDGSVGFKGNVVSLLDKLKPDGDAIYSCGPKIMLKNLSKLALEYGIDPQVSMEERMACGIGACVGCVVKIKKNGADNWEHLKVCKDGPVFLGSEVLWDE